MNKVYEGVIKPTVLANVNSGFVIDCNKWFPILGVPDTVLIKLLGYKVKITGESEGLMVRAKVIEMGGRVVWST